MEAIHVLLLRMCKDQKKIVCWFFFKLIFFMSNAAHLNPSSEQSRTIKDHVSFINLFWIVGPSVKLKKYRN